MQFRFESDANRIATVARIVRKLDRDERGATVIEYGLIVGLIGVVVLVSMTAIGSAMRNDIFGAITTALQGALGSS
ncbi:MULTISPECIES: Flp family type IVb pilin [unclassified Labrenzia]|jgi:pilus assembly protein Flp/PilA|uniref:Flp family type IVb pilin n=1 Tax=unclassified Labrenzia TaxID=2648686 RepID=UPI0012680B61|nr:MULTISPECIES: Flp family type IVb pilin [unclassified Labrenzia]MBO9462054.1 Flp family type IVb pilin [Labrenzia sp. R5_0]QFT66925.1 Flp/Fap pilin component [Labrenzia sp. THAF35]